MTYGQHIDYKKDSSIYNHENISFTTQIRSTVSQMSHREVITSLKSQLEQQIIGQKHLIERILIALLADGHLLVEGAPGLAKTKAIKDLSDYVEGDFHRIQFTPDLLPADITGTDIYRPEDGTFRFQEGPIFHNLFLADEISRHKPRTVICLGDSFDDTEAATGLAPAHRDQLSFLMTGRTWIWIAGNHDPVPMDLGGEAATDHKLGPLTFRHCSDGQTSGEVSGHYHPKVTLRTAAGAISRRCFLLDRHRLILPAFGTYTGGLRSSDATLRALMKEDASAILTGPRVRAIPMSCL